MPPQSGAAEWQGRMEALLVDSRRCREAVDRELRTYVRLAEDYQRAVDEYTRSGANASEAQALNEIAERADRQARRWDHRAQVADWQADDERSLRNINLFIGGTHVVIMAGKIAEIGLAAYTTVKTLAQGAETVASQAADLEHHLEQAENAVRMAKPLEGANLTEAPSAGRAALFVAQVAAAAAGFSEHAHDAAVQIWEWIENGKEFSETHDGVEASIAIVHLLKNVVSGAKGLLRLLSAAGPLGDTPATLAFYRNLGGAANFLGVLKDGIEAIVHLVEAFDSFKEALEAHERIEQQEQRRARFQGGNVSYSPNLTKAEIERLLDEEARSATSTRAVAEAARQRIQRIQSAASRAEAQVYPRQRALAAQGRKLQPLVPPLQELYQRLQMANAGYGINSAEFQAATRDVAARVAAEKRAVEQTLAMANAALQGQR